MYHDPVPLTVPGGQLESLPPRQEQRQPRWLQRNQSLQLCALAGSGSKRKIPVANMALSARRNHERRVGLPLGGVWAGWLTRAFGGGSDPVMVGALLSGLSLSLNA